MGAKFCHQPIHILNTLMIDNSPNPWELHNFMYDYFAIPDPYTCITGYKLNGSQPVGLDIDGSGVIKGTVLPFCKQPCAKTKTPIQCIELNGSNWFNSGRFTADFLDFWFIVTVFWKEGLWHSATKDSPGWWEPCKIPGQTDRCVFIRVLKNWSIDNYLWWNRYVGICSRDVGDFVFGVTPSESACSALLKT